MFCTRRTVLRKGTGAGCSFWKWGGDQQKNKQKRKQERLHLVTSLKNFATTGVNEVKENVCLAAFHCRMQKTRHDVGLLHISLVLLEGSLLWQWQPRPPPHPPPLSELTKEGVTQAITESPRRANYTARCQKQSQAEAHAQTPTARLVWSATPKLNYAPVTPHPHYMHFS